MGGINAGFVPFSLKFKDNLKKKTRLKDALSWNQFIRLGKNISSTKVTYVENMPVTIVHTGGTTGKAKGVVLSNDNINVGARQCEISGLNFTFQY